MARASKTVGTGPEAAAKRARAEMGEAAAQSPVELTFGDKIVHGLFTASKNVRASGGTDASTVADILEQLSHDDVLEIAEPGGGTFDYLVGRVKEIAPMHLRPAINAEIRSVRDTAIDALPKTGFTHYFR